jgi:hypothetical protein
VFNEDYLQWMANNIEPLKYEVIPAALEVGWDTVAAGVQYGSPEVALVTHSTVSR